MSSSLASHRLTHTQCNISFFLLSTFSRTTERVPWKQSNVSSYPNVIPIQHCWYGAVGASNVNSVVCLHHAQATMIRIRSDSDSYDKDSSGLSRETLRTWRRGKRGIVIGRHPINYLTGDRSSPSKPALRVVRGIPARRSIKRLKRQHKRDGKERRGIRISSRICNHNWPLGGFAEKTNSSILWKWRNVAWHVGSAEHQSLMQCSLVICMKTESKT